MLSVATDYRLCSRLLTTVQRCCRDDLLYTLDHGLGYGTADGKKMSDFSGKMASSAAVISTITQHGCALLYASDHHKSDREIVAEAVKQDGKALVFAAESFVLTGRS